MKKGFTLIEIVGVIMILFALSLIIVPVVNKSIVNSREKTYNVQINKILEAAKQWSVVNNSLLPSIGDEEEYNINLSTLIEDGYIYDLKENTIKDPRTGEVMEGCVVVKYNNEYNQYIYEYKESC